MKKSIILLFFCAAALLVWASSGFSWTPYSGGCGDCHESGATTVVHDDHGAFTGGLDCSECHAESPPESPATSTCAGCHPAGDPGLCPLVIGHADAPVVPISCATCHVACDEPEPGCEDDADCDDGVYCNGIESCSTEASPSVCVAGEEPCGAEEICLEDTDECVECEDDADCGEDETCEDNVCVAGGCPPGTPEEVLLFDKDGDCLLNKEELKNYKDTLKVAQKAEKDALKAKQSLEKDKYKAIKINFSTK